MTAVQIIRVSENTDHDETKGLIGRWQHISQEESIQFSKGVCTWYSGVN